MQPVLPQQKLPAETWRSGAKAGMGFPEVPLISRSSIATPCHLQTLRKCVCIRKVSAGIACLKPWSRDAFAYKFGTLHVPRSLIAPARDRLNECHDCLWCTTTSKFSSPITPPWKQLLNRMLPSCAQWTQIGLLTWTSANVLLIRVMSGTLPDHSVYLSDPAPRVAFAQSDVTPRCATLIIRLTYVE